MRLPSINEFLEDAKETFVRFPLAIACAAAGTMAALIITDYEGPSQPSILFKVLLAAALGIPTLIATRLTVEKYGWTGPREAILHIVALIGLSAYACTVPYNLDVSPTDTLYRFFMLAAGLHLVVAFAPFSSKGELNGFWHYNKTLFVRFLTATLFATVLWIGLMIALAALNNLFGLEIRSKRYFELWIAISGLFMTWFFLAGVPRDLAGLESATDYSKGIKVFSQYILFPLVLVYIVILVAYMGKIVITWNWPKGWVSKLILGYSGVGILSLLLLQPIAEKVENIWIRTASRWFYMILAPILVMLFFAVWRRVSEYGVTPGRYLAIATGVWLAGMVVYFMTGRIKSIKVIPVTLAIVIFLASFGPWGMLAVSEKSQVSRFRYLVERHGLVTNGKITGEHPKLNNTDAAEIQSTLTYLGELHGYETIQGLFNTSLRKDSTSNEGAWKNSADLALMMGLWGTSSIRRSLELSVDNQEIRRTSGYDHMVEASILGGEKYAISSSDKLGYRLGTGYHGLLIYLTHEGRDLGPLELNLSALVGPVLKEYAGGSLNTIRQEMMAPAVSGEGVNVKALVKRMQVEIDGTDTTVTSCEAYILYTTK